MRASALVALEVRVRREASGIDEEPSALAEAGALLRADTDHTIMMIAKMLEAALKSR